MSDGRLYPGEGLLNTVRDSVWTTFEAQKPPTGKLIFCTDRKARWLDIYIESVDAIPTFGSHTATHWFLLPDLPK